MTLKLGVIFALFCLPSACGGRASDRGTTDTVMVFTAAPPAASRSGPDSSIRSVLVAVDAYNSKRITADSAARVIVDYVEVHRSLNAPLDSELTQAIMREQRRRHGH